MKTKYSIILVIPLILIALIIVEHTKVHDLEENNDSIELPNINETEQNELFEIMANRRSRREFTNETIDKNILSKILWSAQGITSEDGKRTAPSAGAVYPIDVYVNIDDVENIESGIYKYIPENHSLNNIDDVSKSEQIGQIALSQNWISEAPIILIIAGDLDLILEEYPERGERYMHMEAGHIGQNIYLTAESLDLSTTTVGAFNEDRLNNLIGKNEEEPLYVIPVGK